MQEPPVSFFPDINSTRTNHGKIIRSRRPNREAQRRIAAIMEAEQTSVPMYLTDLGPDSQNPFNSFPKAFFSSYCVLSTFWCAAQISAVKSFKKEPSIHCPASVLSPPTCGANRDLVKSEYDNSIPIVSAASLISKPSH